MLRNIVLYRDVQEDHFSLEKPRKWSPLACRSRSRMAASGIGASCMMLLAPRWQSNVLRHYHVWSCTHAISGSVAALVMCSKMESDLRIQMMLQDGWW